MKKEKTVIIQGKGASKFYTIDVFIPKYRVDEVWKLNNDGSLPIPTRHWEIHDPIHFDDKYIIREYRQASGINPATVPYFKIIRRNDIPADAIKSFFGCNYFLNTICWQIAVAIYEGFTRICLSGCDKFAEHEQNEVDGVRWWVNEAIKRNIEVVVTHMSEIKLNDLQIDRINKTRKDYDYI